jgi:predicted GNAT superfamily acetyltransferase
MLEIRVLETPSEMADLQDLQRLVWPGSETEIVPAHILLTIAHNGGLVLGAWHGSRMVGLLVGFPGIAATPQGPKLKHCSHELGVHPDYRDAGIGFALKRAQRNFVLGQGMNLVTWTYDPLLSRNARLNIARLGAVCNTYFRDLYGDMPDGLNAGLPSDRFQVDWRLDAPRVANLLEAGRGEIFPRKTDLQNTGAMFYYQVSFTAGGWLIPPGELPSPDGRALLLEIPADFWALKAADFELARAWRLFTRQAFEVCFAAGYLVTDFAFDKRGERPRSFYLLEKIDSLK